MIITENVKNVIENSAFITLVTQCEDGTPHPIIAGKGEVASDTVLFGIYKMEVTQKKSFKLSESNHCCLFERGLSKRLSPDGYCYAKRKETCVLP